MPKGLVPARLPAPGSWGLNLERRADVLPSQWATVATNAVFDDSGRLASRKGYQHLNSTAVAASPDPLSFHIYEDSTGSTLKIFAAGNAIYKIVGAVITDISGTITTPTNDNWKFVNFNGKCVGVQDGHAPIVLASVAGSFANLSLTGASAPTSTSTEVLSAYGRLWVIDGDQLLYSDLLDETNWGTVDGGAFDLSTLWLNGMDKGIALADFNGYLCVLGQKSVIVYSNPWVPGTGLSGGSDQSTMTLVENIGGVGCIARDSVQYTGTDLVFLSANGLVSLSRVIQEKSMPINTLSQNITTELLRYVNSETASLIKGVYSETYGFYLLSLPNADVSFYFDTRQTLETGAWRCTKWNKSFSCLGADITGTVYLGVPGYIAKYFGYIDGVASGGTGGTSYPFEYVSGWSDLSDLNPQFGAMEKIPKKGHFLILGGDGQIATLKWAFDFIDTYSSFQVSVPSAGNAEWGEAEWGPQWVSVGDYLTEDPYSVDCDEWSGGYTYNEINGPMRKTGQVVKFGISSTILGTTLALQLFTVYMKVGRLS